MTYDDFHSLPVVQPTIPAWQAVRTMNSLDWSGILNADNFPFWLLPPKIAGAVRDICRNVKVPPAMAFQAVLATVSQICQDRILIRRRSDLVGPASLFMVTLAESGARKTEVEKIATRALRLFLGHKTPQKYEADLAEYRAKHRIWALKKKAAEAKALKFAERNELVQEVERDLIALEKEEPKKARKLKLNYSDATPQRHQAIHR